MRKIILIVTLFLSGIFMLSCLENERVDNIYYTMKPIDSVDIQAVNGLNEVTEIKTYYTRNSECEDFFNFDYKGFDMERTVAIVTWNIDDVNCAEISEATHAILRFTPLNRGEYTFKFWKGNNDENQPEYIEMTIIIP